MEASHLESVAREIAAYSEQLNRVMAPYADDLVTEHHSYLPLSPDNFFEQLRDGVLLGYLLHHYWPESIHPQQQLTRHLDLGKRDTAYSKVTYQVNANLNAVVQAAKSVKGLVVVNLGSDDILQGKRELVLGLLWQIFNSRLASTLSLAARPELVRLVDISAGESLLTLAQLRPDALLHRWINYHLQKSPFPRRAVNLHKDLADCEIYLFLLGQIAPQQITMQDIQRIIALPVGENRAAAMLQLATERLGCRDFVPAPKDIASGHVRLNYAFCASLFNSCPGIEPLPSDDDLRAMRMNIVQLDNELKDLQDQLRISQEQALQEKLAFSAQLSNQLEEQEQATQQFELQLAEHGQRLQRARDELAQQYQESLDKALAAHQNQQLAQLASQKQLVVAIKERLVSLGSKELLFCKEASSEPPSPSMMTEEEQLLYLLREIGTLIEQVASHQDVLLDENTQLKAQVSELQGKVNHTTKIYEQMGDSIRQYAELVTKNKPQSNSSSPDKTHRSSLLKRLFGATSKTDDLTSSIAPSQ